MIDASQKGVKYLVDTFALNAENVATKKAVLGVTIYINNSTCIFQHSKFVPFRLYHDIF